MDKNHPLMILFVCVRFVMKHKVLLLVVKTFCEFSSLHFNIHYYFCTRFQGKECVQTGNITAMYLYCNYINEVNVRRFHKMAKESSFDIVSQVDLSEVDNAINIATKEITTRYDFKGSKSEITLDKSSEELVLVSDDEYKLEQLKDVLITKLIKRGVPTKNLDYSKIEQASGGTVRQRAKLVTGIDKDNAKKLTR